MKVLLVDQFGKTTGRDTLALAELVNKNSDIEMQVYLSDNTEIPDDRKYILKINEGFNRAYEGNAIQKGIHYLKALRELKIFIAKNDIDIVHLQWFSLPWIEWIYVKKLAKKYKVVITVHDVKPFDNRPYEMQALRRVYQSADKLLIHTKTSEEEFKKLYGRENKTKIITQGFCLKSDYQRIEKEVAKKHFNIDNDTVVFLYYGTIRKSKGLDILMEAILETHEKNKKILLLAAGAFHKVEEEEYKRLKDQLGEGAARINFGFVPQKEEQWYFSAADVLCLPYLEVTQSGVAQLGLMYELPIIATDVGEMSDVCRNEKNGILIQPQNKSQLIDAILRFTNSSEFREKASEQSKQMAEVDFSLETKAQKVHEVYSELRS